MARCSDIKKLVFILSAVALLTGCGEASAPPAAAEPNGEEPKEDWTSQGAAVMQDRSAATEAEALYVEKCAMCHRELGMGTVLLSRRLDPAKAELEERDDLTADYVTTVARVGLGNMPPIPRGEVSDEQLEVIAGYLAKEADQ